MMSLLFYMDILCYNRDEHVKGLTEIPFSAISYSPTSENKGVLIENTIYNHDKLHLRSSSDRGGLVRFENKNPYDEWSFSFTVNDIELKFPERAGVYLWYTETTQTLGPYKGGHGMFKGIMAGIEFTGKNVELALASNDGSDYHMMEDMTVIKDHINPKRFLGVKDITVKVISTSKNFKIELYDGNRLIYDNLRFTNPESMKDRTKGKYFTITSHYERVAAEKAFELTGAHLNQRIETKEYDVMRVHSAKPDIVSLDHTEFTHENEDVRHMLASLTHFITYMNIMLGDPHASTIDSIKKEVKSEIKNQSAKIEQLSKDIELNKNDDRIREFSSRLKDVDMRIQKMQRNLNEFTHFVQNFERNHEQSSNKITYIIIGIGILGLVIMGIKEYSAMKFRQKKL